MFDVITRAVLSSLLACIATAAHAHAMLDRAEPRVGSTVAVAPRQLSLWFTQRIESAFSKVEVVDVNGERVDEGSVDADVSNPALLHIRLKELRAGTYHVHWKVLSVDTHTTEGHFRFEVAK